MTSTNRLLCVRCTGTGRIMGGGMIYKDCHLCHGSGKLKPEPKKLAVVVDKRSKTYKDAIAKIMEASDVSKDEAARIFDEEFEKL